MSNSVETTNVKPSRPLTLRAGRTVAEAADMQTLFMAGYRAASTPAVKEARAAAHQRVIDDYEAEILAEYK